MAHTISQRKIIKIPLENPCMWVTNTSYSQICHKYIHIMAWKDQKRKEKATCGNFVSPQQRLWASCYWDDQGISFSFCAIAIQQYTVYHARFMCSFRELHEMWHFIRWNRLLGKLLWIDFLRKPIWNLCRSCTKYCTLTVYGSHTLLQIPSHFTQFLKKKLSKFHLKIPACESQHCLWWNLSQIHSNDGVKRPNKQRNSNLWKTLFLSAAVVSKLLLGCSGHFLFILCHCNPTAHSVTCMIHVQLQKTAWNMTFHMKQIVEEITVNWDIFKEINLKFL